MSANDFWAFRHHVVLAPFGTIWTWVVHDHAHPQHGFGERDTRKEAERAALWSAELSEERKEQWST